MARRKTFHTEREILSYKIMNSTTEQWNKLPSNLINTKDLSYKKVDDYYLPVNNH